MKSKAESKPNWLAPHLPPFGELGSDATELEWFEQVVKAAPPLPPSTSLTRRKLRKAS